MSKIFLVRSNQKPISPAFKLTIAESSISVLDLPQLYNKPSAPLLVHTLDGLRLAPPSWEHEQSSNGQVPGINPKGLTKYLTSIIASSLAWIDGDEAKEEIWEKASARLSERAGRSGK